MRHKVSISTEAMPNVIRRLKQVVPPKPDQHDDEYRFNALLDAARKLDECPYTRQEKQRRERDARQVHQRRTAASRNGSTSVIGSFNRAHPIEALLERHGYTRSGDRLVRPGGRSASVSVKGEWW